MKRLAIATALALTVGSAWAADIGHANSPDGKHKSIITDEPCTDATVRGFVTALGGGSVLNQMVRIKTKWLGRAFEACGQAFEEGYMVVDAEGDMFVIPYWAIIPKSLKPNSFRA